MSKEAYQQKAEAKLEEFQANLNRARAQAKGASADARLAMEKRIDKLKNKVAEGRKQLGEMGDAADDVRENLSKNLDDTWDQLSSDIKNVLAQVK